MIGEKDLVGVIPAGQNTIAFSNKETPFSFDFYLTSADHLQGRGLFAF